MTVYLTPADAARILEVTPAAVRLMVGRGDLRADATTQSGILLFERETVEALAKKRLRERA